jgi:hypothetical protein
MEPSKFWIRIGYVLLILLIPVIATYWTEWGFWENFDNNKSLWDTYVNDEYKFCSQFNAVPTMSPKLVLRTSKQKQIYYDNCRCENKYLGECVNTWKTPDFTSMPGSVREVNPQNIFYSN